MTECTVWIKKTEKVDLNCSLYMDAFTHYTQTLISSTITYWFEGWVDDITQTQQCPLNPNRFLFCRTHMFPIWSIVCVHVCFVCVYVCVLLLVPLSSPARTVRIFKRGGVQADWPISLLLPCPIPVVKLCVCACARICVCDPHETMESC